MLQDDLMADSFQTIVRHLNRPMTISGTACSPLRLLPANNWLAALKIACKLTFNEHEVREQVYLWASRDDGHESRCSRAYDVFHALNAMSYRADALDAWSLLAVSSHDRKACSAMAAMLTGYLKRNGGRDATIRDRVMKWSMLCDMIFTNLDDPFAVVADVNTVMTISEVKLDSAEEFEDPIVEEAKQITGAPMPSVVVLAKLGGLGTAKAEIQAAMKPHIGKAFPLSIAKDTVALRKELTLEFPWAGAAIDAVLAQASDGQPIRLRHTLFVGPPGSGKTTLLRRLAEGIGSSVYRVDGAGCSDGVFAGTGRRWSSAEPSHPFLAILDTGVGNPALLIDEIDKAGAASQNGSLQQSILPFLERETASRHPDPYTQSLLDLSWISIIASANEDSTIIRPLLDRMRIVRVPSPGREHLQKLVSNQIRYIAADRGLDHRFLPPLDSHLDRIWSLWSARPGQSLRRLQAVVESVIDAVERTEQAFAH